MEIAKTIEIELKNGQLMSLDMTHELMNNIKIAFNLNDNEEITEYHIKHFLTSALKNMLELNDE